MRKLPGLGSIGDLLPKGATVVVTGPTSGIGTETAAEFARRGCHGEFQWDRPSLLCCQQLKLRPPPSASVVLACRSLSRGKAVQEAIVKEAKLAGVKEPQTEVTSTCVHLVNLSTVLRRCCLPS